VVKVYLGQMSTGVSFLGSEVTGSEFTWVEDLLGSEFAWVRVRWGQSRSTGVSLLGSEFSGDRVYLGQRSTGVSLLG